MKKILVFVIVALFAVAAFAADVTTTQSRETNGKPYYVVHKSTWTATTNVDSALCLASDGKSIEVGDLMGSSRPLSAQLETAETTAASVDKIFVWFVSNHDSPVTTIASGPAFIADWTEAKRDTFAATIAPISNFDVDTYPGAKVCVMVYETDANTAVAENVKIFQVQRRSESDRD